MVSSAERSAVGARRVLSLRARLLFASAALATLASVAIGLVAVGTVQRNLAEQADLLLEQAFVRAADVVAGVGPSSVWADPGHLDAITVLRGPAQSTGTLAVVLRDGRLTGGIIGDAGIVLPMPGDVLNQLIELPLDRKMQTLFLGDELGNYRLLADDTDAVTVVIGLPLYRAETISDGVAWAVALSTILAIAALFVVGSFIIRRTLRPLETLALTADAAAGRKLTVGEDVGLDRIDLADVDPRSEIGRVLAAYNRMVGNVEGALREREVSEQKVRRFVADASHELRTPLASIRGYSEFVRRMGGEGVPADMVHSIARIEAESLRMQALVEDLLLLTRIDQGQELQLTAVELVDTLSNAVADVKISDPERSWEMDCASAETAETVQVFADPSRLHQVFVNLLSNASSHTPPGSSVTVRVRTDCPSRTATIEVVDDGPGIAPSILPRVFERFVRGDAQRVRTREGGSGLGLPIAAALVHAFGGDIRADSSPAGTTITVELRMICLDASDPLC